MAEIRKPVHYKPYLRENDHPFVWVASFLSYVRSNRKWSDAKIQKILEEAHSGNRRHIYNTLQKYLDER
ncbi:hypothetical protein ACG9Y7_11090 [Acinetobacter gerneri]|jgi:hypothetical protein|uniref:hypothetical protein n=1 Tax=Acinetobacter gerneri TaxID=202952 RepID=UPI003AF98B52